MTELAALPLAVYLEPGGFLAWAIVGLIAGALAGRVVRGRGFGCLVDIVVGLAGSLIGGALLGAFVHTALGFFGSIVVAFIGATILLLFVRLLSRPRRVP